MSNIAEEQLPPLPLPRESECPFDPVPEYARLRAEAPVTKVSCPTGITAWLVTRYADVREVLGDAERFSNRAGQAGHIVAHMRPDRGLNEVDFSRMDGSEHRRFRRSLGPEMSRIARVEEFRPLVERIVEERIEAIAADGPPVDLYQQFAMPVTTSVIAELLAVPYEDREVFQHAAQRLFASGTSPEQMDQAVRPLFEYTYGLVARRRVDPGDDVLSRMLVRDDKSERPFSDLELATVAGGLLMAGFDTTASMIGHGVLALLQHPGQLDRLRADSSLLPRAADELVRYLGVGFGLLRITTRDTEIAGQPIAEGDYVVVALQSANRDPELYADPDTFDVGREVGPHLGFGYGPHQCVGQQLARLELQVVLEALVRRIPSLRLAVPFERIEFKQGNVVQGPAALPVTWDEVR